MTAKLGSVLVVEDNPMNLNLLVDYLSYADFEVFAAEEGSSALDLLTHIQPEVILLDVMMPEMDGFEVCQRIKAQPATSQIPVLFMTALTDTADKIKGFEVGGADYITKPVQYDEVLARLKTHIKLGRLQKQLREQNQQLQREIVERKRAEVELRQSEEYLAAIFNTIHTEIILIDAESRTIADANPAALKMIGAPRHEIIGSMCHNFIYASAEDECPDLDPALKINNAEHVLITAQGETIPIIKNSVPITLDEQKYILESFVSIAERKRAEETLQQYAHELETSNAELDAFAHTVAHDLKNPLTAMLGISGTLQEHHHHLSSDDIDNRLHLITRAGHRMTNIINELLLLASVRKMDEVESSPLDMAEIVANARERINYLIEAAQAQIILPEAWPVALGHAPWIEEVWTNYISNAIKYGGKPENNIPPRITLGTSALHDEQTACFWVRDNGQGLAPEQLNKLFAPFERLGQVQVEGYGLGLSIVRRIAEKLGGEVSVQSKMGSGSTFYFTLPLAPGS